MPGGARDFPKILMTSQGEFSRFGQGQGQGHGTAK